MATSLTFINLVFLKKKKKNFSRVYIRATSNTTWTKNIISPLEP